MAKSPTVLVMLINEEHPETGTKYIRKVPVRGTKQAQKLRMRKYDPVLRKHCWFVQKKLPNPKAK